MQHDQAFIGRQPILNRKQEIIGYELLFRHDDTSTDSAAKGDDLRSCARVLVNTLSDMGAQWLLGDKLAFINVDAEMLHSEFLELLPPKRTVLEVLGTVDIDEAVLKRCKQLRAQGFQIALYDHADKPRSPVMLEAAHYVKLDIRQHGIKAAGKLVAKYEALPLKVIAEKVETHEEFEACKKAGFRFFQGFYFARPETLTARVINPSYATVLDLLNMVTRKAEVKEIEDGFKRDAALSFKLLRYINSVGFGLSCEIQSIRHALTILGYNQLYRWLTLLMVTAGDNSTPPALMKTSITRGRLTELLGEGYFDKTERDNLFIIGVFSLLDAMLEMPMEQILDKVQLPEAVTDALLTRTGPYGPFLQLTEACESAEATRINQLAEALQMDTNQVNNKHIAALAWAEQLSA
jgi:EAL and modified HD-GYP domain-containing signal transduction protein